MIYIRSATKINKILHGMMNIIINDEFFFTGTGDKEINVKMTIAGTVATYAFTKKSLKKIRFVSRDWNC